MATETPDPRTPEEIAASAAQSRFLDSLGIKPSLDLLNEDARRGNAEFLILASTPENEREAKLREFIGVRTPEELLNAFEAVDPKNKPFLDSVRGNIPLATSIHDAVVNDPSVLKGLQNGMGGKGGMDSSKLQVLLGDASVSGTFTALFNKISEKPDDAYTFDTITGLMTKLDTEGLDAVNADLKGMGVSEIELSGSLVTKLMTPDQLLAKIGEEAGFEIPEAAQNDEAFKKALHNAVANDPTVLKGLMDLKGDGKDGAAGFGGTDLQEILSDDRNRGILTNVLDVVAKSDKDKFDFQYMTDFAKAAKEKDMKKLREMFGEMDIELPAMSTEEMTKMLGDFFMDPVGFAPKFVEMMNIDPTSEQGKALAASFAAMGSFVEMIIGGETGYRAVVMEYAPGLLRDGEKFFADASGETDKKLKVAKLEELNEDMRGRGIPGGAPTASVSADDVASPGAQVSKVAAIDPATLNPYDRAIYDIAGVATPKGEGTLGSTLDINAGVSTQVASLFTNKAYGIVVAPEETNEFGNEMRRKVGNNDMSFSMVG